MQNKLISAIGAAATNYFHAAYYKTGTADFYEGKAKGLLNLAADLGLYDHPDIVRYRKTVTDADELIQANKAAADRKKG